LPVRRRVRKLSRGMLSALGVIIGLASRSRVTLFDEPYLGLDAVARQLFYDRLLRDYADHPRTVILSTHLIDEVSALIEHVLLLDRGRLIVDADAETLRGQMVTVTGPVATVDTIAGGHHELHRDLLGRTARVTLRGDFDAAERARAAALGAEVEPVSLQQLVVRLTTDGTPAPARELAAATVKELSR
jgi:ABC-2 type transport system ATP-binding protein